MRNVLAGVGGLVIVGGVFLAVAVLVGAFIYGAEWVSTTLLPWFLRLSIVTLCVVVLVLLPLAIPRATRGFSSVALFVASYVFGTTLWMMGLIVTLAIWGFFAAFLGLFILGVGVVPIAMLATLFNGIWDWLIGLVVLTLLTFGSRMVAHLLGESW